MFCTTECWLCEDKNCKNYISKQQLFFDNQLLKSALDEIRKYIDNTVYYTSDIKYLKDSVIGEDLLQILDKVEGL